VTVAPVSAGFVKDKAGNVIGVVPAANGRTLDQTATAKAIAANIAARGTGAAPKPVKAVVATVQPKVTTAAAQKSGSAMVRLGAWKTWFPISDHNFFGANIWQPAKFIDGTVLAPGQTFEWWSAIGPVTRARGFGLGGFIAGDHTEPTGAMGGGMCSSSTTLFNAALRAGLKINERSNHRYYINRYPLGLDATVSGGGQTMSFTNDMKNPILIRTYRYRSGGKGWVRYEIWGVPDGRKVTLGGPIVSNRQHATTQIVRVSTLRPGVRRQTEYPSDGMNIAVSRVVRDAGGAILHSETFRSHYTLWNGRIEVGR
jgi:vancomycin resistance protein YoaR